MNPARNLIRWIAGGTLLAAAAVALALAVWPASETDKARDDGERFGAAVAQLQDATTQAEVEDALDEIHAAAADTADHADAAVAGQVNDQADALDRAADGAYGAATADDEFSQEIYESELDVALDDLASQADDFRAQGPDVRDAFWSGYQDGLEA
jgi:hypothetical protein